MPDDMQQQGAGAGESGHSPVVEKIISLRKELIFAGIIVGAAIILYAIISSSQEKADREAWRGIFIAGYNARRNQTSLPDGLAKVMEECKGARALFYAQMLSYADLGESADTDDLERAAGICRAFLADFPAHPFAGQVRVDYATLLGNLGRHDEALALYQQVGTGGPDYLRGEAQLFAALSLQRLGREAEALDVLSRLEGDGGARYIGNIVEFAAFARAQIIQRQTQDFAAEPAEKPAEASAEAAKTAESAETAADEKDAAEGEQGVISEEAAKTE